MLLSESFVKNRKSFEFYRDLGNKDVDMAVLWSTVTV